MATSARPVFNPDDYLYGRVALPPFCYDASHRQYPYIYAGSISAVGSATTEFDIPIDPDAHFLVEGIEMISANGVGAYESIYFKMVDTTTNDSWTSDYSHLRDFSGIGDTPKYLTDPRLVYPSATLQIFIQNNETTRTVYVALHGRKIYGLTNAEAAFLLRRKWYQYIFFPPAMAAGDNNKAATLQIYNESDFLMKKMYSTDLINFVVNTATAGTESAEILMQLKDGASDQNFFSQQLAARLVVGSQIAPYATGGASFTNGTGFFLPKPLFLQKSGNIQGLFTNKSATVTSATQLRIAMEGCRIYPGAPYPYATA